MKPLTVILIMMTLLSCQPKRAVIKKNGRYGLVSPKGELIVEPKWDYAKHLYDDLFIVSDKGLYGLINSKGKIIMEPMWDDFESVYEGPIIVMKDDLWGYVDGKGKVIVKPKYADVHEFYNGIACVGNEDEKYGFINIKGDTVIDFLYDWSCCGLSDNGLVDVKLNDSCGYINMEGEIVIPLKYKVCYSFPENSEYARVLPFDSFELLGINKKGKTVDYTKIKGYQFIKSENRYGVISSNGDTIVPPIYIQVQERYDEMHLVQDLDQKWGAYTKNAKLIIKPQFEELHHFVRGTATFKLDGKWGVVDKKGNILIHPIYDYVSRFFNGYAYVEHNGKAGFINTKGHISVPIIYEPNRGSGFWQNL